MEIKGIFKALSPIHQGGNEKTGAEITLNRLSFFIDGRNEEIPIVSGNGIRGAFRRRLARDFLKLLNVDKLESKRLFYMFFAGGANYEVVSEKDAGTINLELRTKIRKLFPIVSLLGGNLGNQAFEGALKCGIARPICQELVNANMLPLDFLKKNGITHFPSFREYLGQEFFTRKDDLRDRKEDEAAVQMLVTREVFVPGTLFFHKWVLRSNDPIIEACFWRGIKLFIEDPRVGGGSSTNMGELEIYYENYQEDLDIEYLNFLDENKKDIIEKIQELSKTWK